ncbi:MAG: Sec-independent protein translocase protein TatB [Pseudomonadota bacterium]
MSLTPSRGYDDAEFGEDMFSVGWPEFTIILIVALMVIGPRDLPKAMTQVGRWVGAARRMSREFHRHVDDMVREAELDEVKDGVNALRKTTNIRAAIEDTVDPDGSLRKAVNQPLDSAGSKTALPTSSQAGTAPNGAAADAVATDKPALKSAAKKTPPKTSTAKASTAKASAGKASTAKASTGKASAGKASAGKAGTAKTAAKKPAAKANVASANGKATAAASTAKKTSTAKKAAPAKRRAPAAKSKAASAASSAPADGTS